MTLAKKLVDPPALAEDTLRIVALGGIGQIGRNMTVFELNGKLLLLDCGVLFPEETEPGVDLILPDLSYIRDRLDDVVALVITHGHEDHIGAIPYLLKLKPDIPLVGSTFTLALVEAKCEEHRIKPFTLTVDAGQKEQLGPFEAEFIAVNHSIPDSLAVCLRSAAGTVLHTGDFKLDQTPLDGRLTDLRTIGRIGAEGVDLFMADSTNADVPGFTRPERDIGPILERHFANVPGKIVLASFASHVDRIQLAVDAAVANGRRIAFMGRSMLRNMKIAQDLGFLRVPEGYEIDQKQIHQYKDNQLVLIVTGSQGEPMAALARMANGEHKVTLGEHDKVILAASLIPGNENQVFRVINGLSELGADIIHRGNEHVHVSGHASSGELLVLYNLVQPKNAMPVHGEIRHLQANGQLAIDTGVPAENVMQTTNGTVVDLSHGKARIVGQVEVGYVYVDGASVGEITPDDLKDRRTLGEEGFISIVTVISRQRGTVVSGPDIHARGLAESDKVLASIVPQIEDALEAALAKNSEASLHQLQQVVRRTIGNWVGRKLRRKPMIVPVVIEV